MHSHVLRAVAVAAFVALCPVLAGADQISDQKKAYQKLGITVPHPAAMCALVTKAEAARYLGKPVRDGESAGPASGCAYRATDQSNDGVLVIRQARSDWYPPTESSKYRAVAGVGEKAYTAYSEGIGYEAGVLSAKGFTNVQLSGNGTAEAALALARIAMNR